MVENRGWLTLLSHAILLLGIAILVFPIYVTFIASTAEMRDIIQPPLPLVPGPYLIENYSEALQRGVAQAAGSPVSLMLWNAKIGDNLVRGQDAHFYRQHQGNEDRPEAQHAQGKAEVDDGEGGE